MYKNKIIILFSILILFTVLIYFFLDGHFSNCKTLIDYSHFSITTFTFVGLSESFPTTQIAKLLTNVFMLLIFYIVFMT
jgi:hypothetical protein